MSHALPLPHRILPPPLRHFFLPPTSAAEGMRPEVIGLFVATAGLPWAGQFVWGPLIDRFQNSPMGRQRPWVLGAQFLAFLPSLGLLFVADPVAQVGRWARRFLSTAYLPRCETPAWMRWPSASFQKPNWAPAGDGFKGNFSALAEGGGREHGGRFFKSRSPNRNPTGLKPVGEVGMGNGWKFRTLFTNCPFAFQGFPYAIR